MGTQALIRKPGSVVAAVLLEAEAVDLGAVAEIARQFSAAGIGSIVAERGSIGLDAMRDLAATEFGRNVPLLIAADVAVRALKATERNGSFAGSVLLPSSLSMKRALGARAAGAAASPTMFLVDGSLAGISLWTRLAGRISGGRIATLADLDEKSVRTWLAGTPKSMSATRKVSIAAAAAAAVAMPVGMVSAAGATPSSVSQGDEGSDSPASWADAKAAAKRARIGGDSKRAVRAPRSPEAVAEAKAKRTAKRAAAKAAAQPAKAAEKGRASSLIESSRALSPSSVSGDGQQAVGAAGTGGWPIFGPGLTWFANTDVTSATNSSASGAVSDASIVTTTTTTTSSTTYTTTTTMSDAFDGYGSLYVRNMTSGNSEDVYNQTGEVPTESCGGQQLDYPTITMDGLEVSRTLYASPDYPFARWLDSVTNPSAAPVTIRFGRGEAATFPTNNLGSDADTTVELTSSGDAVATPDDAFVVTSDNGVQPDPAIGQVLWGGTGDAVAPSEVVIQDGDDQPSWFWEVTIEPGETVSIAQYAVLSGNPFLSAIFSSLLADQLPDVDSGDWSPGLLCMTEDQIATLINYDLPEVTAEDVTVNESTGTVSVTFTRTNTGGPATMQVSLVAGSAGATDFIDPGPITVHFEPGQDTVTINVALLGDAIPESDETFTVQLASITGYARTASTSLATVTIVDDDAATTTTTTTTTTTSTTTSTTAPDTTTTDPSTTAPPASTTSTTEPAATTSTTQPTTTGTTTTSTTTTAQVLGAQQTAQPVARTGNDGGGIAKLAAALLALGGGLVSFGRKNRRED